MRPAREFSPEIAALLGVVSDAEISKMTGVSAATVFKYRKKHKIATAVRRRDWTVEMISALGVLTDREVADQFKLDVHVVTFKRTSLGIPARKNTLRAKSWKPHEAVVPVPSAKDIKAMRVNAELTHKRAAELVGSPSGRNWLSYESGDRKMSSDRWTLFLLVTNQHPHLKLVNK